MGERIFCAVCPWDSSQHLPPSTPKLRISGIFFCSPCVPSERERQRPSYFPFCLFWITYREWIYLIAQAVHIVIACYESKPKMLRNKCPDTFTFENARCRAVSSVICDDDKARCEMNGRHTVLSRAVLWSDGQLVYARWIRQHDPLRLITEFLPLHLKTFSVF